MKSYSIFPKSIFGKSPKFAPLQFRNKGAFWETKNIFGKHYPYTLKNAQETPIKKQFFLKWSFKHELHHKNLWFLNLSEKILNKSLTSRPRELNKISRSWNESRKPIKFQLCSSFQSLKTQVSLEPHSKVKILVPKIFRSPHLTSFTCVPNFKIIS